MVDINDKGERFDYEDNVSSQGPDENKVSDDSSSGTNKESHYYSKLTEEERESLETNTRYF